MEQWTRWTSNKEKIIQKEGNVGRKRGGGIIGNAWKVVFLFGLEFLPLCPFKRICSKRCHFIINKWSS